MSYSVGVQGSTPSQYQILMLWNDKDGSRIDLVSIGLNTITDINAKAYIISSGAIRYF